MAIDRKQLEWLDPTGLQIRGIRLRSADNYAGGGTPIVTGEGIGLGAAGERTALFNAIDAVAINSNVTPAVRRLINDDLLLGSSIARGILSFGMASAPTDTSALSTTGNFYADPLTGGVQSYLLNRVRIRDAFSHNAILNDLDSDNEVWGILCHANADTDSPYLLFYSGDPETTSLVPIDITATVWYSTQDGGNNTDNMIEIILNESVEYRDRPYGHTLREVSNFFDVSFDGVNLPITIYTDTNSTIIDNGSFEAVTLADPDITVADGTQYRIGARVYLTDGTNTVVTVITNIVGNTVTVASAGTVADGAITIYQDISEFTYTNATLLKPESANGEFTTIEAYVNGVKYIVTRVNIPTVDVETAGADTDWVVSRVATGGVLTFWWLGLGFSNPDARFELDINDEVYFTIHSR